MDSNQHQKSTEKAVDKKKHEEEETESFAVAATVKQKSPASSPAVAAAASAASPPSASSSSPSHEFSFTISLHSSSSSSSSTTTTVTDSNNNSNKTKTTPPSFAIDLSPADEIFFHGHLLPLHLLSHLPVSSPRSSTNSLDSFTLPIKDTIDYQKPENKFSNSITSSSNNIKTCDYHHHHQQMNNLEQTKGRANKSKSFSLFGFTKWRKGYEVRDQEGGGSNNKDQKQKKKLRFDLSHAIKKYMRMIRPMLIFRGRRENGRHYFQRQPYSFSGNLSFRKQRQEQMSRGRGGGFFSAPASIITSPTNSGLLVATKNIPSSTSDSTMEELHAAIQAAIAHCKNSIAVEEKLNC